MRAPTRSAPRVELVGNCALTIGTEKKHPPAEVHQNPVPTRISGGDLDLLLEEEDPQEGARTCLRVIEEIPAKYNGNNPETIYYLFRERLKGKKTGKERVWTVKIYEPERYEISQKELVKSRLGWKLLEPWLEIQTEPDLPSDKRRKRVISELLRSYRKEYHKLCPATRQGPGEDILNWLTKRYLRLDGTGTRREGESDDAVQ
ncbi:hypothetical protein CNMCM8927_003568 [Aspergillus lentulus]|uniref:Uncharacterized protein n=1 Tax=Aspergillus lentulus TaxID=293939 RepID=A0AAN5YTW0_ASPLE|nr:hypothetical protein CNMCM8927_003568 [Aspergillus lentulus]